MSQVTRNQPDGTPTWVDLAVPDLARAMDFYGELFGWEFEIGMREYGYYTFCLLDGRPAAGLAVNAEQGAAESGWTVYLATADIDVTIARAVAAGGVLADDPFDVHGSGLLATLCDPVGARFGLWEGRGQVGSEVVNEPGALLRNDLVTPTPGPARDFYAAVFGFGLDRNDDTPDADFTFLRRPDGHEVGGILGNPAAPQSRWNTVFEVADTDAVVRRAGESGGKGAEPTDTLYGRLATITDPFGTEFLVITREGA